MKQAQHLEQRILIIDDDLELCSLVAEFLAEEGFQTESSQRPEDGLERAVSEDFHLVILDVMLPGMNGFEVLRRIRERSPVPVLMLTARGEDVDRIVGLEIGADDYLAKPFNPRELAARIRAILRRSARVKTSVPGPLLEDDLELVLAARTVRRSGEALNLTSMEFDLLALLLQHAGDVLTREELSQRVLGRPLQGYDRSIDVHISHLRKKLGPHRDGSSRIQSVRNVGYLYCRRERGK